MIIASEFGTGQFVWSMLWFTLFFMWVWLVVVIFADIIRSDDMSGWAKALWSIFVIVLPYLGVFSYLIARGSNMSDNARHETRRYERYEMPSEQGSSSSTSDQLRNIMSLRRDGLISDEEFKRMKSRVTA